MISAYFDEKSLVHQQLRSYEDFIQNRIQKIVDDSGELQVNSPQSLCKISFGQIYLGKPAVTESYGETAPLFPRAARLRNLTYSAPLYVDATKTVIKKGDDGGEVTETENFSKLFIGEVKLCSIKKNILVKKIVQILL